jgi:ribonuclease HI
MNEKNKKITINYTNHRGETRPRHIIPIELWFGVSEWHDGEQWFLRALDIDKDQNRDFALLSVQSINSLEPTSEIAESTKGPVLKEAKLFTDGGSRGNPGPSAIGYVILDMNDQVVAKKSKYLGITTNNQAEYQGLKEGLELCREMNISSVRVFMDSLLVVNQIKGVYKVKNRDLWPTYESIKELITSFKEVTITHVPRELNKIADGMVNECLDSEAQ